MILCDYGCGKEAKFQFKNGKWCCSKSWNTCLVVRNKKSISLTGLSKSEEHKKKLSKSRIGKPGPNLGKVFGPRTEEWKRNHSEDMKGKNKYSKSDQHKEKLSKSRRGFLVITSEICSYGCNQKARYMFGNGKLCCSEFIAQCPNAKKKNSESGIGKKKPGTSIYMKNGGAHKALLGVKNPSGPELKLRDIVKNLYPASEHTYKILNYAVDNAIIENKIAIEFDGYYHFCDQEHIDYHNKRQKEIEEEGWEFLRYNIYQKFPTLEQVREDIKNSIWNKI